MLILYYRNIPETEVSLHWGIMLIFPGAFGNLLDRIIHPELGVIDFIRIGIPERYYWPIFNLADVYVTAGIVLLIITFIAEERRKKGHQELKKIGQADSDEPFSIPEGNVSENVE
jgi:signal peptidase II